MIQIEPRLYSDLCRALEPGDYFHGNPLRQLQTAFGVPVHMNSAFPHEYECGKCSDTGEGTESTYCKSCGGAGRVRIIGMVTGALNRDPTVIVDKLPKAFQPSFPSGIVAAPPLSRGLA